MKPASIPETSCERRRSDWAGRPGESLVAALAALLAATTYVAIAATHGALGASRGDDWAYYKLAFRFAESGSFALDGWTQAMFVGQALWARPVIAWFGSEFALLQITVAAFGAAGLWATHRVVRSFLSRWWSTVAVGCLALGPLYGSLSVSFMTDVPAFALQALALLAGLRAVRAPNVSMPWFVASLSIALAAFSVREFGMVAGCAVSVCALCRARMQRRCLRPLLSTSLVWLLAVVALYVWRSRLPDAFPASLLSPRTLRSSLGVAWRGALTLALFISPAVLTISPRELIRAAWQRSRDIGGAAALIVLGAAATAWWDSGIGFVGNYFEPHGSYSVTLAGEAPAVAPVWAWRLFLLVGLASMLMVVLLAGLRWQADRRVRAGRTRDRTQPGNGGLLLVTLFSAAYAGVMLALVLASPAAIFDRYLVPLVPFAAALVIRAGYDEHVMARLPRLPAIASLLALGWVGFVFVDASATFDGAKWRLAQATQQLGLAAPTIDGGYEWFGFHQPDDIRKRKRIEGRNFWITLFSERPVCATSRFEAPRLEGEVDPEAGVLARIQARSLAGIEYHLAAVAGPDRCD